MDVLTGAQMRNVDADTIARFCPGLELMERAGRQTAEFILERFPEAHFKASIFVGPGNNGGDALVVARYLSDEGRACSVHYTKPPERFSMDALKNHQRLQQRMDRYKQLKEINYTRPDWTNVVRKDLIDSTLIVDGLFGTGLARDLEGRPRDIVNLINESELPVVSLDIPSGIHSDTGDVLGVAVRAHHTITMGFPKLGMLFHPGKSHVGELVMADLGFPDEVLQAHSIGIHLLDCQDACKRLAPRPPDLHKYRAGTVLLVAGSRLYTGAALLAAEGALRSGCGMLYAAVPESIRPTVQSGVREAIAVGLPETTGGSIDRDGLNILAPYMEKADVVVVGPGLGTSEETVPFIRELVARSQKPLVVDADAINAFAGDPGPLGALPVPVVLTPHSGELGRLLASDVPEPPLPRVEFTRETAKTLGVTLIHKGAPSLVASADGEVWVSQHGNSALATAGTGDVLTGIVGGTLAQGVTELDAACMACFLHGRAGELASESLGLRGVIAGDLLVHLGSAILELERCARI